MVIYAWNSLVHKDDASNLLVRLRLNLVHGQDEVAINKQHTVLIDYVKYGADPAADACRAVAEIGKAVP